MAKARLNDVEMALQAESEARPKLEAALVSAVKALAAKNPPPDADAVFLRALNEWYLSHRRTEELFDLNEQQRRTGQVISFR